MLFDPLARQFSRPSGMLGDFIARFMNVFNGPMNARTIEAMRIEPRHHVLDIGFGGGPNLAPMADRASEGLVTGLDLSGDMVARAKREHRGLIRSKRMVLHEGSIQAMPFRAGRFDSVSSVNNVYFWPDPARALAEVRRVLKPGGIFVLAFRPKSVVGPLRVFTPQGFHFYSPEEVRDLLEAAGFSDIVLRRHRDLMDRFVCAIARKPKTARTKAGPGARAKA